MGTARTFVVTAGERGHFSMKLDPPRKVMHGGVEHSITESGFGSVATMFENAGIEPRFGERYRITVEQAEG